MKRTISLSLVLIFCELVAQGQSETCLLINHVSMLSDRQELSLSNTYNEEGKLTEENRTQITNYGDSFTSKRVLVYNEKGFLTKITNYHNDNFKNSQMFVYDGTGKLISETERNNPNEANLFSQIINEDGVKEKLYYGENGNVNGKEVTEKSESGQIMKYQLINEAGEINHESQYTYNENNKAVYLKRTDVAGSMVEEIHTSYNMNGDMVKDSTYLNGDLIAKTILIYSNTGLIKKTRYGRNNRLDYEIAYVNNSEGQNIEESFIYNGEMISSVHRTFDLNNNIIEEKRYNKTNELVRTKTWEYSCPN